MAGWALAGLGEARRGLAVKARQGRRGGFWLGLAGMVRPGKARLGPASRGWARYGMARHGRHGEAGRGEAGSGGTRHGMAG